MKIENSQVFGFDAAVRAMRNPMNSWAKSDTTVGSQIMGEVDSELASKLIKAGKDHRKFLRCIHIQVDLTLPRCVWQELDTYKVSTVRVSCSTMHKLGFTDLTKEDFEGGVVMDSVLEELNALGREYRVSKDVGILRDMKYKLPEGFLQKSTYDMSYEVALNIYHARKSHRMPQWKVITDWIASLPMMDVWTQIS